MNFTQFDDVYISLFTILGYTIVGLYHDIRSAL